MRWARGVARARGGAVCFPQRFGGSLNLNVHYHVAVPDGVFTEGGARAAFHNLPRPSQEDLETIAINVEARVLTWLERRGFLAKPDGDSCERQDSRSALDACLEGSLGLGELTALPGGGIGHDDLTLPVPTKPSRRAGRSLARFSFGRDFLQPSLLSLAARRRDALGHFEACEKKPNAT
jgi:hypothetical protein